MREEILGGRIELFGGVSPLQRLANLEKHYPGSRLYMKRDDLSLLALGGNKLRKLEYLLYDAIEKGADTLITAGAPQSNHCRQTAGAAAKAGLECHLVLGGESPKIENGNILLDRLFGATIHFCEKEERNRRMDKLAESLREQGKHPYIIPVGGSNAVGALGYVKAAIELGNQIREQALPSPVRLIIASSSGGTHAGMQFGSRISADDAFSTVGIRIDKDMGREMVYENELAKMCNGLADIFEFNRTYKADDFSVDYRCSDQEYGSLGERELSAMRLLARDEAIVLDPVYTARAMAGLLDMLENDAEMRRGSVIFLHSGGSPAVFAYAENFKF